MDRQGSRRTFLQSGATAFAAGFGFSSLIGGGSVVSSVQASSSDSFDPNSPEDNLRGFVKTMGSLDGSPQWMIGEGRIYALVENEMPVPLVAVKGMRYIKFTPAGDSFNMSWRDWAFYADYETGKVLETFENPYTGARVNASPLLTNYFSWRMGPDGQELPGYAGEAWLIDRPLRMPWVLQGGMAAVTLELLVKYGHGGSGTEWVNLHTNTKDFLDPDVASAPMRYSWQGYSPWMRWLEMGDRPGRTLRNSNGIKTTDIADLRPEVRAVYDAHFPGSIDNPETYEKTGGTTSTA